jgi:endoglucanase
MKNKTKYFLLLFILSVSSLTFAGNRLITNITNAIGGVGDGDSEVKPYICIQNHESFACEVKPGGKANVYNCSGNKYYLGASLRFGGCSPENTYLGFINVNPQTHAVKYQSPSPTNDIHIEYSGNTMLDDDGVIAGKIQYTPIQRNFNLTPATLNSDWDFVGVNLSGLEFGKVIDPIVVPNLSQQDAQDGAGKYSDLAEIQAFIKAGMNTVRLPLSWGYLQLGGAGQGKLNTEYFDNYIKPTLETLTHANVNVIVDLHAYMRYSKFGKEISGCGASSRCPDGTLITDVKAYQDVWGKLYTLIKNDKNINMNFIVFDLMNEPVDLPTETVFDIETQLIKSLRQQGFQGYILVEGNSWSGLHSWMLSTKSQNGKVQYKPNGEVFTRDNFVKAGINLDKIIINAHQYFDSNFSGNADVCEASIGTEGENGFNLAAFLKYLKANDFKAIVTEFGTGKNAASCTKPLNDFLNYLQTNSAKNKSYGFVGWTIWSTGHGWGDYSLRVTPESYQMKDALQKYLQPQ